MLVTSLWVGLGGALGSMGRAVDVAAQLPHGALRFYVMGERGTEHAEVPTEHEIEEMARLTEEALHAGALGFTTSRTTKHKARDGRFTPSLSAREAELLGIAQGMKRAGRGVLQVNSDFGPGEFEALDAAAALAGRPLSCLLVQVDAQPKLWRETLDQIHGVRKAGREANAQVGSRPIGVIMGLETTAHPFAAHPAWLELRKLSPAERYQRLAADADLRRRLVEDPVGDGPRAFMAQAFHKMFPIGEQPDYEPDAAHSIAAIAQRSGRTPEAVALDEMMARDGKGLLMLPFENYAYGSLDVVHEMITDPATVLGIADGGAHVGVICEAAAGVPGRQADARHGRSLRPARPRPAGTGAQGRHQHHRLRRAGRETARGDVRPAGRRPPPDPARVRLSAHLQCRRRDAVQRRADRRASRQAGARSAEGRIRLIAGSAPLQWRS